MQVYIDGHFYPEAEATVSIFDHGFLYGDGIFEGIRLYSGCLFKLEDHLERLEYSAKAIRLQLPWTRAQLTEAIAETCRRNHLRDGYIRLIVTRGKGSLGLNPSECQHPQLIMIAGAIQLYPQALYEQGMKIITVPTRRMDIGALPPTIKSLNYMNNVLAKMEGLQHGYHEVIMLNAQGTIAECTGDNFFIVHKGKVATPLTTGGALAGITRETLLALCAQRGIPAEERAISRYDAWIADECFLTGTAAEVIPVVEIDGRTIGTGAPGPITQALMADYKACVVKDGVQI